ncbi:hypothetical protein B7P43_G09171 [Cryptotermes secundus]|uniref:Endonuclease/exonuclease/phosphatase domain-containing protein n=1 Tax=Cryptotermes secundus TaxID=105785 RepID=A0A2J7QA11_9NEOP|nr:hypothetical protein B7P43_G09171 [Cryptotermes secundus]
MLIDFCERNGLIVTNTWFKKPKRRIYTWKAPGDWKRHQLDYILVKHRFRNSVKDVKTLPGADIDSDHNLLVAKFRTRVAAINPTFVTSDNLRKKVWILLKLLLKFPADFQAMLLLSILQQLWHKLRRNPPHVQFL